MFRPYNNEELKQLFGKKLVKIGTNIEYDVDMPTVSGGYSCCSSFGPEYIKVIGYGDINSVQLMDTFIHADGRVCAAREN